jgi:hypothetical protein
MKINEKKVQKYGEVKKRSKKFKGVKLLLFHIYSRQETYILSPEGLDIKNWEIRSFWARYSLNGTMLVI